jgi:hypothetical protein
MARPRKVEFPIGVSEMLRLALPTKRPEDRMRIFREWSRSNLMVKRGVVPTDEEAQAEFDLWCQKRFDNLYQINDLAAFLNSFTPHFSAVNRKKRAQVAAAKSWSMKNRQKRNERRTKKRAMQK